MKQKDGFKSIFGTEYTKETYQMKGHSFSKLVSSKPVCISCGLIALNNDFSKWCIDKGCYADLHPQYESVRKRLTKMW